MVRCVWLFVCFTRSRNLTDDVLKARLKTVGVSEYSFHMEAGDERGTEWRIIDVGGSRSQVRSVSLLPCRMSLTCAISAA